jgi:hypothetical protein
MGGDRESAHILWAILQPAERKTGRVDGWMTGLALTGFDLMTELHQLRPWLAVVELCF